MAKQSARSNNEKTVKNYFAYIRDLRNGKAGSVENLVELWDIDGTFEFAGAPPVTGTFQGRTAIRVLYQNRFKANGMTLTLQGALPRRRSGKEVALGVVDTEVHRTRALDGKIVAGWTTVIGTDDGRGFEVSGSHTFTFRDGKIRSLKVVVSPRPDSAEKTTVAKALDLKLDDLHVDDIGRLALAAWPVV
jgi:ketosteroid isomerase-like protein